MKGQKVVLRGRCFATAKLGGRKAKMLLPVALVLALVAAFALVVSGCDSGGCDSGGGTEEKVNALPPFEGAFVASEEEATALATGADTAISQAISEALAQGGGNIRGLPLPGEIPPDFATQRASTSGHYTYNGVSLDYTATYSDGYPSTYPFTMAIVEMVTIQGTYYGYKIDGDYNIKLDMNYTSSSAYNMKIDYDCIYTVSYNGKGMKVVYTGDMTAATPPTTYTYNLNYAVYDNSGTAVFVYKYNG
jgi:hypothetical protein